MKTRNRGGRREIHKTKKEYPKEYSLNKNEIYKQLDIEDRTLEELAVELNLRTDVLHHKLTERQPFNRAQITKIVYFFGAHESMDIIWFPSVRMKEAVYEKVFGQYQIKGGEIGD